MRDEGGRRRKAAKILAVVRHALGRQDLAGMRALDVGCSLGFIANEFARAGAAAFGVDIDEAGLAHAHERFGGESGFAQARGEDLPFHDHSMDVVVFNHIYEHVVDPEAVVSEIGRVLAPQGVLYLGLSNKFGLVEPHHRLPFLSWLPTDAADVYVRATGRAHHYHERLRSRQELKDLFQAFDLWEYTLPIVKDVNHFASGDVVPGWASNIPAGALSAALPFLPTFVWVGFPDGGRPLGPALSVGPQRI
jgi:SAM-dependent methyltransferase